MASVSSHHPVGIFWDIENCQVPYQKSALQVVQRIRDQFCNFGKEVEFVCACDVTKERKTTVETLSDAQITLLHVPAISKNAADEKLKTCLHKFSSTYRAPGSVVIITTDVNFAPVISDLRYRFGFHIVLIHNRQVSEALYLLAHQRLCWHNDILESIPATFEIPGNLQQQLHFNVVLVTDLPVNADVNKVRERLHRLSVNCGGRVLNVDRKTRTALLKFSSSDLAERARTRINNEDVFGCKVKARLADQSQQQQQLNTNSRNSSGGNLCSKTLNSLVVINSSQQQSTADPVHRNNNNTSMVTDQFTCRHLIPKSEQRPKMVLEKTTERGLTLLNNIFKCHVKPDRRNKSYDHIAALPSPPQHHQSSYFSSETDNSPEDSEFEFYQTKQNQRNRTAYDGYGADGDKNKCTTGNEDKFQEASRILRSLLDNTGYLHEDKSMTNGGNTKKTHSVDYRLNKAINNNQASDETPKTKQYMATYTNSSRLHPVDVRVDNIDSTMPIRSLKDNLYSVFSAMVRVLHVTIVPQSSGGWFALVQVASKKEAIESVNRLNQVEFGKSHIIVSIATHQSFGVPVGDEDRMKQEAHQILSIAPTKSLPLTTFLDLLQTKLKRVVSVSEIKTMTEVVRVVDGFKAVRCYLVDSSNHEKMDTASSKAVDNNEQRPQQGIVGKHGNADSDTTGRILSAYGTSGTMMTGHSNANHTITTTLDSYNNRRRSHFCLCSKPHVNNEQDAPYNSMQCLSCCKLRDQVVQVLNQANNCTVPLNEFARRFEQVHSMELNPNRLGYTDLLEMIDDMQGLVKKCVSDDGQVFVRLRQTSHYQETVEALLHLFLTQPEKELTLREFQDQYRSEFGHELPMRTLNSSMTDIVELFEGRNGIIGVRLTAVQKFALRIRRILLDSSDGHVTVSDLEHMYRQRFNEKLRCRQFGFANLIGLLRAASHVLYMKGRGQTLCVCINRNFLGFENKKRPTNDRPASITVANEQNKLQSVTNSDDESHGKLTVHLDVSTPRESTTQMCEKLTNKISNTIIEPANGLQDDDNQRSNLYVLEPVANFMIDDEYIMPKQHEERVAIVYTSATDDVIKLTSVCDSSSTLETSTPSSIVNGSSGIDRTASSSLTSSVAAAGNKPVPKSRLAARFSYLVKV